MIRWFSSSLCALFLCLALAGGSVLAPSAAQGAEQEIALPKYSWPFSPPFGTFDRPSLQRGFQIYHEVCAACHGLKLVAVRDLAKIGFSEAEILTIAARYNFKDTLNDDGELVERPGRPADRMVSPYANDNAARAANGGSLPPDLSLMAKARFGGPDYIRALLTGYEPAPPGVSVPAGQYYNKYFPGHLFSMPLPLSEGQITYSDGTAATIEQMASDVAQFLMWAAEPNLEQRHAMGVKVLLFLLVFAAVLYAAKRRIWAKLPSHEA
jgi:ubiquinol-cytochrome c reductase cytochrome c1 subunit